MPATRASWQMYIVSDTCQPAAAQRLDSAAAACVLLAQKSKILRVPSYFYVNFNATIGEYCTGKKRYLAVLVYDALQ